MKIHIVDDNKRICDMYTTLFSSKGYEVKTSSNGLTAITDAVDYSPDIVLLDILMPEMNGYQFLDALKNNTSMNPVVIILSNLGEQIEIDRAMQHGADGYLQKSDYTGQELVDAVNKIYTETLYHHQAKKQ